MKKQPSPVYPSEPGVPAAEDFFCLQEWESRASRHLPSESLSRQAEPFRMLRSQLMLRWLGSEDEHHSIAILSPDRNEGRTHIAANLALVFAEVGQFTLLIDADLRNPSLHTLFNTNNATGLSTILVDGEAKVQRIVEFPSLTVLTAGPIPPDPEELLSRESFLQLIDLVRDKYDVVIIDTPAAGSSADAYIIAARARAGLIVARRNITRVARLDSLVGQIGVARAAMLGIVHNEG
jgi:protein-tyrosine kinase